MPNTTESKPKVEVLNPVITCHESQPIEEPLHHVSGGLTNPFFKSEKVVDKG
jgi:hypothetical protein